MYTKRRLLKNIDIPTPEPFNWYTGILNNAQAGHNDKCGWLISPGASPSNLDSSSPVHAAGWAKEAHLWLDQNKHTSGIDNFATWHTEITKLFHKRYPDLSLENVPSIRKPWLDAAIIDVKHTRSGVEINYISTGLIAISIHRGVNERWILPPSLTWHRQHFAEYSNVLAKYGVEHPNGKKALTSWHTYCRKSINQPGGFSGWSLGDPIHKGWATGRIHVSETPFSVVLYNIGAMSLVDIFRCYSTHKELFDYIRNHKKMDTLLEKIQNISSTDMFCQKYPREMTHLPVSMLSIHGN